MINNRLNSKRTAQGGFTLVELLVVIGIIAILAGVALGPITNGIKKAKQSTGLQTARTIALAEFSFSNDNDGSYPDAKTPLLNPPTATDAGAVVYGLVQGKYISDPSIFYISGSKATKYTGLTDAATIKTAFTGANSSWDFVGNTGGVGLNTNTPDNIPVLWSTVLDGATPVGKLNQAGAVYVVPDVTAPFGVDGVAVAYKNNGSKFALAPDVTTGAPITDSTWQACGFTPVLLVGAK